MRIIGLMFVVTMLLPVHCLKAQLLFGVACDLGNQAQITPNPNSILRSPITVSGSLNLLKQEDINERWGLQYGIGLGVLGFNILASQIDTLTNDPSFYDRYPSYNIFYTNFQLSFGRRINVARESVSIFVGGGASHLLDIFGSNARASTSTWNGSSFVKVFEYDVGIPKRNVNGYLESSIQWKPNHWSVIGLRYRRHFTPSLLGQYSFYHTKNTQSGQIELTSNTLSVYYLVMISRK